MLRKKSSKKDISSHDLIMLMYALKTLGFDMMQSPKHNIRDSKYEVVIEPKTNDEITSDSE